jgi:hypothetical protein
VRSALFVCFAGVQFLFFFFSPGNQKPRGSVLVSLVGAVGALSPVGSSKLLDRRGVALTQGARTLVIKLSVFSSVVPLRFLPSLQCPGLSFGRRAGKDKKQKAQPCCPSLARPLSLSSQNSTSVSVCASITPVGRWRSLPSLSGLVSLLVRKCKYGM